jgi:hypothetical protein
VPTGTRAASGHARTRQGTRARGARPPGRGARERAATGHGRAGAQGRRGRRGARPRARGVGSPGRRGAGAGVAGRVTRAGEKEGEGEGKREMERERERELTSGSKSGDHRLQNLGHHGEEREVGEGGSCCAGELNEGKRPGEGGAWERDRGARVGLGRVAGLKTHDTHNH